MANYNLLGNDYAQQLTVKQCQPDSNYQALQNYFVQQGMQFNLDRNIALVGINPENPGGSYTMVISPTFTSFDFKSTPSHTAASIVSYFSTEGACHIAAIAEISHNPLQIANITLVEIGKDGSIVTNKVDRVTLVNQSPAQIAKGLTYDHLITPDAGMFKTVVSPDDLGSIATVAFNTLLNDQYASPLYPTGGVGLLKQDGVVSVTFANAVNLRGGAELFEITVCTSTSSNACTSCSSSFKLSLCLSAA